MNQTARDISDKNLLRIGELLYGVPVDCKPAKILQLIESGIERDACGYLFWWACSVESCHVKNEILKHAVSGAQGHFDAWCRAGDSRKLAFYAKC